MAKKKVAAIVTEYRLHSHADVIVGKILEGFNYDGGVGPNMQLVSMYVDQFPPHPSPSPPGGEGGVRGDMSRDLARKYGFKIFPTIEGALTLSGSNLAVDRVLSIGEHCQYPSNDKGHGLYPRRRFFSCIAPPFAQ